MKYFGGNREVLLRRSRLCGVRSGSREDVRWWPALALLCVAQFAVVLDVTIVAIALPEIQDSLGFSRGRLWPVAWRLRPSPSWPLASLRVWERPSCRLLLSVRSRGPSRRARGARELWACGPRLRRAGVRRGGYLAVSSPRGWDGGGCSSSTFPSGFWG